jgi:hypothetical protein
MDDKQSAAVTAALDPETFAAAYADGARMPIADALAYGLAATTLPGSHTEGLSAQELGHEHRQRRPD